MKTPHVDPNGPLALTLAEVLGILGRAVGEVNVANGWDTSREMVARPAAYPDRWRAAHKIAELGLIATEACEAIDEVRAGHPMTFTYYRESDLKPEGVPSELADVVIRVLGIADAYGIDLAAAIIEKLNHNATRGLHHGGRVL